ncbi:hypothetical protein ABI59_12020 [Acidobacteria bacterium Mor1]|nr:hypothetical protein ABI59_12020 [Acidobacteria bacterium Mor1]
MLAGSIKRKIHWEFWPPWIVYPPVVLYLVWQAIRLRGPLLFTAANPAIDASGFIDESKQEILQGLAGAGEFVARHRLLPRSHGVEQRVESCRRFIDEAGLDYPVVLKPDAGQRGSGVQVVRDEAALRSYLVAADYDTIVQEYAPGEEFGVFYYRYPHEERGRIFSITEKRMPVVVGDGERTVERLILDDPRAVSMASIYLAQQTDQERVPAAGEEIQLVELGTHCRGAIFLDGGRLATAALAETIDRISRGYEGFFFGRYDLRTPDPEDLARGRNFKIVELNGVTSEATHIYDPAFSLFAAYRVLFKQWRVACEIGAANRKRGVAPVGFGGLIRRLRDYRQSSRNHP